MKLYWPVRVEDRAFLNTGNLFGMNPGIYAQFGMKGHNGLDFPAPEGVPVYAVHDGWIVEATAKDTGYGLRIGQYWEEDGFGWLFTYGHFLDVKFPNLTWDLTNRRYFVRAGDVIGRCDSTGFSTGHHVHGTLQKFSLQGYLLDPSNGFGGAIDWLPYLADEKEKPAMSNVIFVHKEGTPEYGFYIPATMVESLKDKALNFGLDITKPDGSVDFGKAKGVKFNE